MRNLTYVLAPSPTSDLVNCHLVLIIIIICRTEVNYEKQIAIAIVGLSHCSLVLHINATFYSGCIYITHI